MARGLSYAGEAGWTRVAGAPEAWEAAALFSAVKLAELRAELEEDLTEDALARETAEPRAAPGPPRCARRGQPPTARPDRTALLARAIERHFGLPARPAPASTRDTGLGSR